MQLITGTIILVRKPKKRRGRWIGEVGVIERGVDHEELNPNIWLIRWRSGGGCANVGLKKE